MHHLAVKSNLVVTGPDTTVCNNPPICPKPRRLGSAVPEFIKTLGYDDHNSVSQMHSNGSGILNMITSGNTLDEARTPCSTGCSQSCYSGSPPGRTSNPLIHDVQFVHQMEQYSPFARKKLHGKFAFASASPA
ncbi:OLC1v1011120C1 [Oldenlandia corymbosa var. corymbosa]|uniref:OLC1v1011120C1 n=1 Tax=Oldenlandia corymbosa var. corymbosa TaxID=529605 RepID=A0AAV1DSZ0_OLDCO|nr:OLC1v1011120C1 [Oldenlandia corymbosa var. corymbosa]